MIVWKLPCPASAVIRGPDLFFEPRRLCRVSFSVEGADGAEEWIHILFHGVEASKCTFLTALGSVDRRLRTESYGALLSVASSDWLSAVTASHVAYHNQARTPAQPLEHFMICFDDGPCYEFVAAKFEVKVGQPA